ncbi:MAG: AMMECR1 domain-containing protein, partial [Lachnospiraceae bacterium]|nr:AMMECR1 domain-containing protein [Lachnospiraceae bacterium]
SAGTSDPRFPAVTEKELDELVYTVDVMGQPEKTTVDRLDVKKYGVIVSSGYRRGLLLPNLDGVDTVEEQIAISRQKGGIGPDEAVEIERFMVERHT